MWFTPWHLLYATWILWDINYFWAKLQVFSCFLSREKPDFVERNAAPHSHNFPNLDTHQNASETFFAEFSRCYQNTLTSSVGVWGNVILDQKRNHIAASFTEKNKLKVFTWKTITPPFSKILLVARFTLLWRHDGPTHWTAALTSLWLPPGKNPSKARVRGNRWHEANIFLSLTRASIYGAGWDFFSWAKLLMLRHRKKVYGTSHIGRALFHKDFTNLICSTLYVNNDSWTKLCIIWGCENKVGVHRIN